MSKTWIKAMVCTFAFLGSQLTYCADAGCGAVIQSCDNALSAQKLQIQIRDQELGQAEIMLQTQAKEIDTLKRDEWFRSPYLWIVVGLVAGTYAAKR